MPDLQRAATRFGQPAMSNDMVMIRRRDESFSIFLAKFPVNFLR